MLFQSLLLFQCISYIFLVSQPIPQVVEPRKSRCQGIVKFLEEVSGSSVYANANSTQFQDVVNEMQCIGKQLKSERLRGAIFKSVNQDHPDRRFQNKLEEANQNISDFLFDLDILLTPVQVARIQPVIENSRRFKRKVIRRLNKWNFPINYRIDSSLNSWGKTAVQQAIKRIEAETCITFKENNRASGDFLEFFRGSGCYSYVGKVSGRQQISIGSGCEYFEITIHEIGHALGFFHEQSSSHRDNYISVNTANVKQDAITNFWKQNTNNIGCYDFGSIMHYSDTSFSANGRATLVAKDSSFQDTMGSTIPSFIDFYALNQLYCASNCGGNSRVCENGGYPDPKNCNVCKCPTGFDGKSCLSGSGNTLFAGSEWQSQSTSVGVDSQRDYLITAGSGKLIEIQVSQNGAGCVRGNCGQSFVEVKTGESCYGLTPNFRRTGYRMCTCSSNNPKKIYRSASNKAVVIKRAGRYNFQATFQYRAVVDPSAPIPTTIVPTPKQTCDTWEAWSTWSECCGGCPQERTRQCSEGCDCNFFFCESGSAREERKCCTRSTCALCSWFGCCPELGYYPVWSRWHSSIMCRRRRYSDVIQI